MDWKRIAASVLMLGVLAVPASAASITPQTTMKEIRDDPDIKASGLYTYTYVWERDCEKLSTSRDDETLTEVVGKTSAEACAAGLNYLAQVYHDGTRVTYPLYTDEEIAAVPARAHAELYYCPAQQPGARFAIVLSGNALYYSGELRGGGPRRGSCTSGAMPSSRCATASDGRPGTTLRWKTWPGPSAS